MGRHCFIYLTLKPCVRTFQKAAESLKKLSALSLCILSMCMELMNRFLSHIFRLINVDETQSQEVDVGAMFREWSVQEWRETTPDFLQSTSQARHPHSNTVHIASLEIKSLLLHLKKRQQRMKVKSYIQHLKKGQYIENEC